MHFASSTTTALYPPLLKTSPKLSACLGQIFTHNPHCLQKSVLIFIAITCRPPYLMNSNPLLKNPYRASPDVVVKRVHAAVIIGQRTNMKLSEYGVHFRSQKGYNKPIHLHYTDKPSSSFAAEMHKTVLLYCGSNSICTVNCLLYKQFTNSIQLVRTKVNTLQLVIIPEFCRSILFNFTKCRRGVCFHVNTVSCYVLYIKTAWGTQIFCRLNYFS